MSGGTCVSPWRNLPVHGKFFLSLLFLLTASPTPAVADRQQFSCDAIVNSTAADGPPVGSVRQEVEKYEAALFLLLGFGGFSVLLAFAYNSIRRHVFRDVSNLDSSFDAGGRVTMSLTAVTVGVQLLWPADLLQSATVTAKYGIAGAFWYSSAVVVNIILFPLLSLQFKTKAPGAKTFLQVIGARFGARTHIVFCVIALFTNIMILTCIIIGSTDLFQSLIADASDEFCVLVMAALFGSYSFVGGLGSTFYVSYFNAVVAFLILAVFVVRIVYVPDDGAELPFGDLDTIYERLGCLSGPRDNMDRSYATFLSLDSLIWMVQGTLVAASVCFCDQAAWQSRIAAKPVQGVLGFFGATFLWFAIPTTIGTTTALSYLSFSAGNASLMLSESDINAGLVTPYIAQQAMGRGGAFMILIMFTMLMMSTGSGEVMGISSIIVYDFFQAHVCPFRAGQKPGHCILCGKVKKEEVAEESTHGNHVQQAAACRCHSVNECKECREDQATILHTTGFSKQLLTYQCTVHGEYRTYQDALLRLKSWTILCVSLAIVPVGLLIVASGMDLNWAFMTGCVFTIPCFPGVVLAIVWVKASAKGMIIGALTGLVCGVTATFAHASTLPGGLGDFWVNTSEGYTVLMGSCTSFLVTLVVTVVVSLCTHSIRDDDDVALEWQKARDIDNPLSPWTNFYREEFPNLTGHQKPSYQQLEKVFRKAKVTAVVGCVLCLGLFVLLIPGVMASLGVLTASEFKAYVTTMHVWSFVMAVVVIVLTPMEEVRAVWREMRTRRLFREKQYEQVEKGGADVGKGGHITTSVRL